MEPKSWEERHWKNVVLELRAAGIPLTIERIPDIVKHMSFAERSVRNKNLPWTDGEGGCSCYIEGRQCHPEVEDLNCLLCACPNYDTSSPEGSCKGSISKGNVYYNEKIPGGKVWDCSSCNFGHDPKYVARWLEKNMNKLVQNK